MNNPAGNVKISVQIGLMMYEEEGVKVVYSPALDIYGYGSTEEEAKNSFHETIQEYIRYTTVKSTLFKELKKLGWKMKPNVGFQSPSVEDLAARNQQVKSLLETKHYTESTEDIMIPSFA